MDCITCHNRISHLVKTPERAVDQALYQGDISSEIPFIRARAVELLAGTYGSSSEAESAFATLDAYYQANYPEFYADGQSQVASAISQLGVLYGESNFPEQKLDWRTHPDNIGHRDAPGCFRCHDGQHFSAEGEVIRLECNLCHSIPQVVRPDQIEPTLPLTTGLEPASHLDSTWIARHHMVFDASCTNCHTTTNPGGIDDQSFCANSGCHGIPWRFAGFDAPGLAKALEIYQVEAEPLLEDFDGEPTYTILQPFFAQECGGCHGPVPSAGLRLTDYESLLAGSQSGPVVVAGEPEQSRMIEVLSAGHFAQPSAHQMDLLSRWIANGVPE
jgi:hypothetical protein